MKLWFGIWVTLGHHGAGESPVHYRKTSLWQGQWVESNNSYSWESLYWYFPHLYQVTKGFFLCEKKRKKERKSTNSPKGISEANFQIGTSWSPLEEFCLVVLTFHYGTFLIFTERTMEWTALYRSFSFSNSEFMDKHVSSPSSYPILWVIL